MVHLYKDSPVCAGLLKGSSGDLLNVEGFE